MHKKRFSSLGFPRLLLFVMTLSACSLAKGRCQHPSALVLTLTFMHGETGGGGAEQAAVLRLYVHCDGAARVEDYVHADCHYQSIRYATLALHCGARAVGKRECSESRGYPPAVAARAATGTNTSNEFARLTTS